MIITYADKDFQQTLEKYRLKTELLPLSLIMILIHKNVDSKTELFPLGTEH